MITRRLQAAKKKQKGIALLVFVVAIALTITALYFSSISIIEIQVDNEEKTRNALKQAKQALLNYLVVNWSAPGEAGKIGKLPCTDSSIANPEGVQVPTCGNAYANAIGFFPWRTLGLEPLQDSSGTCLLYAVSPAYKNSPDAALNPDSFGQFQIVDETGTVVIQGTTPEDRPVAVILAPGVSLTGQIRAFDLNSICGKHYTNINAYLDNDGTIDNAAIGADNVIDKIVQMTIGSDEGANPLNDRLITITYSEVWSALNSTIINAAFDLRMRDLTEAITLCFAEYGKANGSHLPMPAKLDINGGEYRNSFDYDDSGDFAQGFAGRLPYTVTQANTTLSTVGVVDEIFKNTFCDDLNLAVGTDTNIDFSGDTGNDIGAYYDLWNNWKDHFFYAISKVHNPSSTVAPCAGDCVQVNTVNYAGIVFYSGLKQGGQQRYTRPFDSALAVDGVDDKDDVGNYLENGNDLLFPDNSGDGNYSPSSTNDIMFCINTDMSVVQC